VKCFIDDFHGADVLVLGFVGVFCVNNDSVEVEFVVFGLDFSELDVDNLTASVHSDALIRAVCHDRVLVRHLAGRY